MSCPVGRGVQNRGCQQGANFADPRTETGAVQKAPQNRAQTPYSRSGWNPSVDPENPGTAESASADQREGARPTPDAIPGSPPHSRGATPDRPSSEHDNEAREQEVANQMATYDRCFVAAQDLFDSHHSKRLRNLLDGMAARKAQAQVRATCRLSALPALYLLWLLRIGTSSVVSAEMCILELYEKLLLRSYSTSTVSRTRTLSAPQLLMLRRIQRRNQSIAAVPGSVKRMCTSTSCARPQVRLLHFRTPHMQPQPLLTLKHRGSSPRLYLPTRKAPSPLRTLHVVPGQTRCHTRAAPMNPPMHCRQSDLHLLRTSLPPPTDHLFRSHSIQLAGLRWAPWPLLLQLRVATGNPSG